jgi:hypothetical protein
VIQRLRVVVDNFQELSGRCAAIESDSKLREPLQRMARNSAGIISTLDTTGPDFLISDRI